METTGGSDTSAPGPFEGSSASRAPASIAHGMSLLLFHLLPPVKLPQEGPYSGGDRLRSLRGTWDVGSI